MTDGGWRLDLEDQGQVPRRGCLVVLRARFRPGLSTAMLLGAGVLGAASLAVLILSDRASLGMRLPIGGREHCICCELPGR